MNIFDTKIPAIYIQTSNPVKKTGYYSHASFGKNDPNVNDSFNKVLPPKSIMDGYGFLVESIEYKILEKFKTFSPKEYKELSDTEIETLRKTISYLVSNPDIYSDSDLDPRSLEEDLNSILSAYKIMKENLNKKYSKGCVFISIGRSPAIFAKLLELEGYEVKFCPCISLREDHMKFPQDFIKSYSKYLKSISLRKRRMKFSQDFIESYSKYLSSIGITKDAVKNSQKPFVFVDYTKTGDSLKNFENLLKYSTGIKKSKKVDFISLNKDLLKANNIKSILQLRGFRVRRFVKDYFYTSVIKTYSPSPQISNENEDIAKRMQDDVGFLTKLMLFHIIDKNRKNIYDDNKILISLPKK